MKKHLLKISVLLLLVAGVWSCRKEHALPTANVLASYKGSDKNVLKIIDELKKPENKDLLAALNQQGEVDWQNYKAMLTSDFMQGLTLRFYQGPDSNYFDAQLNLETKDLRLLSKAQKLLEREQLSAKIRAESKAKDKATTTYTNVRCKTAVDFEYVLMEGPRTTIIDMTTPSFSYMVQQFISLVSSNLYYEGFAWDQNDYVKYIDESPIVPEVYQREIYNPIKNSFDDALADLQSIYRTSSGYFIFGFLRKIGITSITCTTGDGGGGGGGGNNSWQQAGGDEEPASYNWRNKLTSDNWSAYLNQEPLHRILNANGDEIPNPESFNCHYYTFHDVDPSALIGSQASDGWPKIFDNVLLQNWQKVTSNIEVGDVVLYFREGINGPNTLSHSGKVVGVDAKGNATLISSKMGVYQIITHHPRDIPVSYGSNQANYIATNGVAYPSRIYFRKK